MQITITNPRIVRFYREHPNIDFDTINLMFIELIEKNISTTSFSNISTMSETINNHSLYFVLNKMFSTSEIIVQHNFSTSIDTTSSYEENTTATHEMMLLKRMNKNKILLKNTSVERNITTDEINLFLKQLEEQKCNGIYLSHKSGFTSKPNFHIEIYNKYVIVYVHNVQLLCDKIKSAIDIIDNLHDKIKEFNHVMDFSVNKEVLEEINTEYQTFILNKEIVLNAFKENQKKMFSQIEELHFPSLEKYLSSKFSNVIYHSQNVFKCDLCKNFNAHNLKALAAHKRGCCRKNNILKKS